MGSRTRRARHSLSELGLAVARAAGSALPIEAKRRLFRLKPGAVTWDMPELGFAYVQVPKVATTSMRAALAAFAAGIHDVDASDVERLEAQAIERYELNAFPGELRRISRTRFTFAFVRNPLDRLYSAYVNKVDTPNDANINLFARHGIALGVSFAEFVERVVRLSDDRCDLHLRSQHKFLTDRDGLVVSHVGRFENLEDDWRVLMNRFGFPPLPHRNISSLGRYEREYTPKLTRLVADRYRRDIELFGYEDEVARLAG